MPGGKLRLKGLFTGGMQVSATGTYIKDVLAGSVVFECGSLNLGASGASGVCEVVTIAGLTASHILQATTLVGNACTILRLAKPGVGQASFFYTTVAASMAGIASQTTTTIQYIAFKV